MKAHPALIDEQEIAVFLDAVRAGDTQTVAARKAGWSLNALKRRLTKDEKLSERYADAKGTGTHARADLVDERFDGWVDDDKCAPALRIVWAKRWHPGYRERIEVAGTYGGTSRAGNEEWHVDMRKVIEGLVEAGARVTIEPAEENGPAEDVSGPPLLTAPAD